MPDDLNDGMSQDSGRNAARRLETGLYLMPATFEERGAGVPFTTPALMHSRVRKDWRDRLELMVSHFTDAKGHYIVPWDSIPEIIPLTVHDRILHREVKERKALDPVAIRQAALVVAQTGLAGPLAEEAANRLIKQDEEDEAQHQVLLILQIIRSVEKAAADQLIRQVMTKEGQERIRHKLTSIGAHLGLDEETFDEALEEFGRGTTALGVKWNPTPSRLRRALSRLIEFRTSIISWGVERLGDAPEQANFCGSVADHTIKIASEVLKSYDSLVENPISALRNQEEVFRLGNRFAWLLDGWELITESWLDNTAQMTREAVLADIVAVLPVVPRKEAGDGHEFIIMSDFHTGRRWVRPHTDWRTGELDDEMVQRLEFFKALIQ